MLIKKPALLTFAYLLISCAAHAGDAPNTISSSSTRPTWTGCYVGVSGGYISQLTAVEYSGTSNGSNTGQGGTIAGQGGCDVQSGDIVLGAQYRIGLTNFSGTNDYTANSGGTNTISAKNFSEITGRFGYLIQPETLFYFKAGTGWVRNNYSDYNLSGGASTGTASETRNGYIVGGGVEQYITKNWTVFLDYSFMKIGWKTIEVDDGSATWDNDYRHDVNIVMLGLNYRF